MIKKNETYQVDDENENDNDYIENKLVFSFEPFLLNEENLIDEKERFLFYFGKSLIACGYRDVDYKQIDTMLQAFYTENYLLQYKFYCKYYEIKSTKDNVVVDTFKKIVLLYDFLRRHKS